ncbi:MULTISPECIES: nuclear transport factor 2 family protein [Novosphingobium]|jgi:ketosteroid isomerase-like protein|uniref:nuclear transport factor 2 family protein n=1 Tax=Novosphingobium TaxID=165696 RepID=UPI0022F26E16|nr:nuclear transport factor 2 family protein [Novosphingobium resinovorum]GLK43732.1 hypothetical protein GCM10017612_16510 [Novosphingobium resinovorum]
MQFTGPAEDRAAIRELMETYADAASRIDKAQWLDCWAPDAEWITSHAEVRGHEALSRTWDDLFATMEAMVFFAMPGAIQVSGDTAKGRCHVREIARIEGKVMKFAARYDDELVRHGARWRFARRIYAMNIAE